MSIHSGPSSRVDTFIRALGVILITVGAVIFYFAYTSSGEIGGGYPIFAVLGAVLILVGVITAIAQIK